jgi:acyl-CoA thioester hydrolase
MFAINRQAINNKTLHKGHLRQCKFFTTGNKTKKSIMERERFAITRDVQPEDIDMLGHVNNIVYLRWVQEAAIAHWNTIAPQDEQNNLIWVVRRHEIDFKKPALMGDTIIVQTWIGSATRLAFDRHTEILRASDKQLLAIARTVWCPIDRNTGRPTDVSSEIRALFSLST